jgi:alkylation response protein AidB-like acyl-CoA dehydrogenase
MGQKGCPASELVFEDCFVPDENVCISRADVKDVRRGLKEANMQLIDFVVSMTRPGVGALATGVARGAYQAALEFARDTEVEGKLLINHEWAQCMLAEMYKNVALARLGYTECGYVNALHGMTKLLSIKPVYYYNKYLPTSFFDSFMPANNRRESTTRMFRKMIMDGQKEEEAWRASGWASLAKFAATDFGVENCHLAVELMGQAGVRQDRRAEKCLRDSKLLQIYEGTNQLNRLNLFKCLIGRSIPEAESFED